MKGVEDVNGQPVSTTGQPRRIDRAGSHAIRVETFSMPQASRYPRHEHDEHQLTWTCNGVLVVVTGERSWVLPPTRALWIPGGIAHEATARADTTVQSVYLRPESCPIPWSQPVPVRVGRLFSELVGYLAHRELAADRRTRAEALLLDILEPADVATLHAPVPRDQRAAQVACALLDNPADPRTLDDWSRQVRVSSRTLARAFRAGTGVGFTRWRTLARLQAALPELALGVPVSHVARHVGYGTTSAFVAAFRRETGTTPSTYFDRTAG